MENIARRLAFRSPIANSVGVPPERQARKRMAVVAYAVVHGSDKILTQRQTASGCLETVKLLEAQAEPDIHILDADGAEMSLGQIEELQKEKSNANISSRQRYLLRSSRQEKPVSVWGMAAPSAERRSRPPCWLW
ncbi:hypothetical protein WOA01_24440 [Methylocystis sp. IM2]|uniref:hypothetical protein n=1 Tax=Methylocystis sp. IM2 TaxID=3136563 RepID=UPI0030F5C6F4